MNGVLYLIFENKILTSIKNHDILYITYREKEHYHSVIC